MSDFSAYLYEILLIDGICCVFLGVGLATEMFFQNCEADIEIRIFQIPRVCM